MSNFGALDMALDDVISQNRKQRKSTNNKQSTPSRRGGASSGGINKNRAPAKRSSPYNAGARPSRNNAAPAPRQQGAGKSLVVSNLHFNVTEKDLYDLFGQIGPVKRAFLHIGPNGKSAGIADVVFQNSNDAERARTTYNNVELDNRPMRITSASITTAVAAAAAAATSKTNNARRNTNVRGANRRGGNNGRPSAGNRKRENRPKPNEQDLDADMDSYMGSAE